MSTAIKVPEMGESILDATISRWMKQPGERVAAGEPVVELETDKINLEVSAPVDGVVERIEKSAGQTVAVGEVLAYIAAHAGAAAPEESIAEPPGQTKAAPAQAAQDEPQPISGLSREAVGQTPATPLAKKIAASEGISLDQISGSGTGGKVTREDVLAYARRVETSAVEPTAPLPVSPGERREERIRMSRRRQTIARRLVEAQQTAAMLTTFNEVDLSEVIALRKRYRETFQKRHAVDLGYMSFFVKAVIAALRAFPNLNAEIQGDEIVRKHYYDIGVAVGDAEGLVVPVIRDADQLTFAEIERQIQTLVKKAGEGSLTLEDLRGGTFTITNGGVFGSLLSTPILNPPQVGILGMHRIQDRPVAMNGEIVIRPMMYLALSYDHRIVDGREAVQFLVRVKELLEDPARMLVETG